MNRDVAYRPTPDSCQPLTCGRELQHCWIAGARLETLQRNCLARVLETALPLFVRSDAWVPCADLTELVLSGLRSAYVDAAGEPLAWVGGSVDDPCPGAVEVPAPASSFLIRFPWDLLRINELEVGFLAGPVVEGVVSERATIDGLLHLGRGSTILAGVVVEGNVVIGRNCKIGPNCYLRGNTAIGDGCHIGQAVEVKNSLIMPGAALGHLSYCGDSVVGEKANFGAGTITANYRHDGGNHRSLVDGQLVDTGRRKLGAMVGDGVHTGIHTSIYPGRKIWPGLSTRPGEIVQTDLR